MLKMFRKRRINIATVIVAVISMLAVGAYGIKQTIDVVAAVNFEKSLEAFPESYRDSLRALHKEHPNWTFEAVNTGTKWSEMEKGEYRQGVKVVPTAGHRMSLRTITDNHWYETPTSWKAYDEIDGMIGTFDYEDNLWSTKVNDKGLDTGEWNQASKSAISYIMDPRNWLTEDYIFMFASLSYDSNKETVSMINATLKGTFMYNTKCPGAPGNKTYAQVIVDAAKKTGISALHIATRLRSEKGTNNDELGKGVVLSSDGKNYKVADGTEKVIYYNYFNKNASGNGKQAVINNGAKEAVKNGWTSPYLAIMGGATIFNANYIADKRDTVYAENFNYIIPGTGQYAQNLTVVVTEGNTMYNSYKAQGVLDKSINFRIPVYDDMPKTACPRPTSPSGEPDGTLTSNAFIPDTRNPNTRLKSLTVSSGGKKLALSPTYSSTYKVTEQGIRNYVINVEYNVSSVDISATAFASTTKLSGTGTKKLSVGYNTFKITSTAEYGNKDIFTITIRRGEDPNKNSKISELKPTSGTKFSFSSENVKYKMTVDNSVSSMGFTYKTQTNDTVVELRYGSQKIQCSNGKIAPQTLKVGNNIFYVDVYDSSSKDEGKTTYQITVTREQAEPTFNSGKLQINNTYINGFNIGEKVADALKRMTVKYGTIKILDNKTQAVKKNDAIIATGDYVTIYNEDGKVYKQYQIVIYGDVNGDGQVNILDHSDIKIQCWYSKILKGAYSEAADVNTISKGIDILDMADLKLYMWYKGTLKQTR